MPEFIKGRVALVFSFLAFAISGCTSLGLTPLPNPYEDVTSVTDSTLTTLETFNGVQDALADNCETAKADTDIGNTCVALIRAERTIRPGITAAGLIGAEYADIDARIKELGPQAPAEWVALAAETAGRLEGAYSPIRDDVNTLILKVDKLAD